MGKVSLFFLIPLFGIIGSCSFKPDTQVIRAFGENEKGPRTVPDMKYLQKKGVVYWFEPGDRLSLNLIAGGDFLEGKTSVPVELRVKKKLYIYSGPRGMLFSEDGQNYKTMAEMTKGSISLSLGLEAKNRKNTILLQLQALEK